MSSPAPAATAGPRSVDPRLAPLLVRSVLEREPSPESLAGRWKLRYDPETACRTNR